MSWGLWVHAGDVAKEGVPALLDEVANVGKACMTSDIDDTIHLFNCPLLPTNLTPMDSWSPAGCFGACDV